MPEDKNYVKIRGKYKDFFNLIDTFLMNHKYAKLEYDELNEANPTLGFVHFEGEIEVHTTFLIKDLPHLRH
jgi:hypothetical protein